MMNMPFIGLEQGSVTEIEARGRVRNTGVQTAFMRVALYVVWRDTTGNPVSSNLMDQDARWIGAGLVGPEVVLRNSRFQEPGESVDVFVAVTIEDPPVEGTVARTTTATYVKGVGVTNLTPGLTSRGFLALAPGDEIGGPFTFNFCVVGFVAEDVYMVQSALDGSVVSLTEPDPAVWSIVGACTPNL